MAQGRNSRSSAAKRGHSQAPAEEVNLATTLNEKDFKFRFKRIPNTDPIENGFCSCCFVDFKRSYPGGQMEQGLRPLVCYGCLKMCHKYCYGITTPTKTQKEIEYFVCDNCRSEAKKQSLCQICGVDQGMLKEIKGFGFVHFMCAITHQQINIKSYETMKFQVSANYQRTKRRCEICKADNSYFCCSEEQCQKSAHPYCVLTTFKTRQAEGMQGDVDDIWKYYISAGENKVFDVSHELPEKEWIAEDTENIFKRLEDFKVPKPDKREVLNIFYDELLRNHKPTSTVKRGGFQYILCPTHSKHNMYCVCLMTVESREMVLCECCLEWYHYDCGSFKGEELYICPFCVEWFKLKEKILKELEGDKAEGYELRVQRQPKFNIPDFILFMMVADRRLQAAFDGTGSLGKLIKSMVYYYPLKTSKIGLVVKELNQRRIEQADEAYLQDYFRRQEPMLQLLPVITLNQDNQIQNLQANQDQNQNLREYITAVQTLDLGPSDPPFRPLAAALDWKEQVVKLKSNCTEAQLQTLLSTTYPHPEVAVLRERLGQLNLRQQIAQSQNTSMSLQELDSLRQNALKIGMNVEAEALETRANNAKNLLAEVDAALAVGVDYDQFKVIEEKMKQVSNLKVTPINNAWENYKKQVNFINDLFMLVAKANNRRHDVSLSDKITTLMNLNLPKVSKELKDVLKQLKSYSTFASPKIEQVYKRFNKIAWEYDFTTMSKEATTAEILKNIYSEGQKLQLPADDPNLQKVSALYQLWESKNEEYQQFFSDANMTKIIEQKIDVPLIFDKIDEMTNFYNEIPLNTKREVAMLNQKKVLVDFGVKLTSKLGETGVKLATLKELFRQADSIKFPKTSQLFKRLNDLLVANNLLLQQFTTLQKKVQEKMDTFKAEEKWKKQRKQQIKSNADKPTIKQAQSLVEQMRLSPVDYTNQIEVLENYIRTSNDVADRTRFFMATNLLTEFQSKQFWDNIRKESEDLRKRILIEAPLNINAEQIELYHFEIKSRIIMSFKGFIPSDLDKLTKLLKFADEQSIQLQLGEWYTRLKTEVEQGTQLQKQLDQLKTLEEQLNKQYNKGATTAPYTNLATLRRVMNLQPLKISSSPLIMGIAERAKKFENRAAAVRSQVKPPYEELKSVYLEGLRIPVELSALQWLAPLVERSTLLMRKWNNLTGNTMEKLIAEYDKLEVKIDAIENDKKSFLNDCQNLQEIFKWIQNQNDNPVAEFDISKAAKIEEMWDSLGQTIKSSDRFQSVRIKFLEYWVNLLKYPPAGFCVNYLKVRGILNQLYEYLRKYLTPSNMKNDMIKALKEPIEYMEKLIDKVADFLAKLNRTKSIDQVNASNPTIDGVIDVIEICMECRSLFIDKRTLLIDLRTRRPYNDLSRFYYDYDRISNIFADEIPRQPEQKKKQESRDLLKRPLPQLLARESIEEPDSRKRFRKDQAPSQVSYQPSPTPILQQQTSNRDSKAVLEQDRKQIRDILARTIKKNPEFKEVNAEDHTKMIQNQIFGDWHQNRKKYLEVSQSFEALFISLQECPLLSSKVKKKNFEFISLKGLVENIHQIADSQEKLQTKLRKQKQQQQQREEQEQAAAPAPTQEDIEFKKEIDQIFEMRKQKEKEQRERERDRRERERERDRDYYRRDGRDARDRDARGDRDGRGDRDRDFDRKYGRDKDRERERERQRRRGEKQRSRSRSRDKKDKNQELRFSDDQQSKQILPQQPDNNSYNPLASIANASYLEKEYNIRGAYEEIEQKQFNTFKPQPFLIDPDEEQKPAYDKEKDIPKGTVIKLKEYELDFVTRNKGKVVIPGAIYTIEDVKRIKQFCDPGFERIVIRKDKKESDILQYLAKPPKKKYKNLVGWFEATHLEDNQYLRDLAQDCQEGKRVYGIQNDLLKMHIMSSRQLNKQLNNNRLIAPSKISSESVARFLGERRMVFIMQFFAEKLYETKFTAKNFSIVPLDTSFEIIQQITTMPVPDYYVPLDHRYSTGEGTPMMLTPTTMPTTPQLAMGMMGPMKHVIPEEDYRQKVDYEGWNTDVNIPDNPVKPNNKNFSPITSEDEGEEIIQKKPVQPAAETKSTFDLKNFLKNIDPEAITKIMDNMETPAPPPISAMPNQPFIQQPQIRQQQPQHPPSYVYQPAGRMPHQMGPPPLVNHNVQRGVMPGHMGMGGVPMMPQYNTMLPPPMPGANRYPGPMPRMPPQVPQPGALPQPFYASANYGQQMMGHMPPPPSPFDMMRRQQPPYMMPNKDDKKDGKNQ